MIFCGLLLAGCAAPTTALPRAHATAPSSPTLTPLPQDAPMRSSGCGTTSPLQPGSSGKMVIRVDPTVSAGATTRTYLVHVPAAYAASSSLPVVLAFHGYSGTAAGLEAGLGLDALAEQQHFLAVYPQGLLLDGQPFWASAGPVDEGIDELPFVKEVLDDLQRNWCVDAQRIYATGFSNGGGMVGFLACRLAGRIAAFAPVAGNYYAFPGGCHPIRAVPLLLVHGTADPVVPYMGISAQQSPAWPLPAIPTVLQAWAERDGCRPGPEIITQSPQLTVLQWSGCTGDALVVHYRIEGGGHALPPTLAGQPSLWVFWRFFQAHPLPPA